MLVVFLLDHVGEVGTFKAAVEHIRLGEGQVVISMVVPQVGGTVLSVSENGYGKRTAVEDFPAKGRGSQGVIAQQTTDRNGALVGAVQVHEGEEIMLISDQGTLVRTRVDEVSVMGRNTQGVRLIKVKHGEHIVGVEPIKDGQV